MESAKVQQYAIEFLRDGGEIEAANTLVSCSLEIIESPHESFAWFSGEGFTPITIRLYAPRLVYDVLIKSEHPITQQIQSAIRAVWTDRSSPIRDFEAVYGQPSFWKREASEPNIPRYNDERDLKMWHVFLSYCEHDAVAMRYVYNSMSNSGIAVWAAPEELPKGSPNWRLRIVEAITQSMRLVVLISPDTNNSRWVLEEIAQAEESGIQIIPVIVRGEGGQADIPMGLKQFQRYDIRSDPEVKMQKLINQLKQDLQINNQRIAWEKTANFYWLISDLNDALAAIQVRPPDLKYIQRTLRQSQHHAREIGLTEIVARFAEVRSQTDEIEIGTVTNEKLDQIRVRLGEIKSLIKEAATQNQPSFDPGLG